jgi:uncharacterized membrane protein YbjE (DUF340 family)
LELAVRAVLGVALFLTQRAALARLVKAITAVVVLPRVILAQAVAVALVLLVRMEPIQQRVMAGQVPHQALQAHQSLALAAVAALQF